ncbi:MAG: subunit of exonuclease SbcCD [Bacilli bacterium]|nr:subunit of exonuclease SbcCD [Bacilli bacterium]
MKPIHLAWSGLQSYREKQEIDFTMLCDAGVFGIFGPTGSGKSTILDAMTLALYGKVERASNGTQGILNHAENVVYVSFTFELSHADGPRRYRIDRQFKRASDVSVNSTLCRLIEIHLDRSHPFIHSESALFDAANAKVEQIVLADKAADVNIQVQQILGLTMQDFSRAVVLPQGKFAEFLALKGTDRRQMLQRLFHLEHYGDVLNAKISQRTKETDMTMKQVAAEQQGLGDASELALQASKAQLAEAEQLARQQRMLLEQIMQQWEEQKQIRSLQQERLALEAQRSELSMHAVRVNQQEKQLKSADQAGRIHHFLQEWEGANQQLLEIEAQLEQKTQQFNAATKQNELFSEEHELRKAELISQDASLQVRMEQLKQAMSLESDIQRGRLLENELLAKQTHFKQQLADFVLELQKKQDIHKRAMDKQNELNEELKKLDVKAEFRQLLQSAMRDKHRIEITQAQVNEGSLQIHVQQQQINEEQSNLETFSDLQKSHHFRLLQLLDLTEKAMDSYYPAAQNAERLPQHIMQVIERCKQAARAEETRHMVDNLAHQLQMGQPCPVCGSTEHPTPAKGLVEESNNHLHHSADMDKLEQLHSQAQQLRSNQQRLAMQWSDLRQKLAEATQNAYSEAAAASANAAAIKLPILESDSTLNDLTYKMLEEDYQTTAVQLQSVGQKWQQLTDEMKKAILQKSEESQRLTEAGAQIQAKQAVFNSLQSKYELVEKELQQQIALWSANYKQLSFETVQQEADKLSEMDRIAEQLRGRLEQSIPFIEMKWREIQELLLQNGEIEKQIIQIETELKGQQQLNKELLNQFSARLGTPFGEGVSLEGLMNELEQLLLHLRQNELNARQQKEQFQTELQQLNECYISLRQASESAKQIALKTEKNWIEAIAKTEFSDEHEVKKALLSADTIFKWQAEVNQHREQSSLWTAKWVEINDKLLDRAISEQEWFIAEGRLAEARAEDERVLQNRAKAERDLEQLQTKHSRWCELEEKGQSLKQLYADLIKLQTVLRGNAFVEYIAEEQLIQVSKVASERLGQLTRQRFALEVDSSGGFVIRDDANGGIKRPVGTLSGGETFLASLALALALSAQIQLNGQYPLEFFFLDEGFGTLDPDLLETVVDALEKLHIDRLTVGVISHVPELRARLPRKLIVQSAEPGGRGSQVFIES